MRWALLLAICCLPPADALADEQQPAGPAELFRSRIAPLLQQSCLKCHSGDQPEGGLSLSTRAQLLKGGDSGPAVSATDVAASLLLQAVRWEGPQMPPTGRLPAREIEAIQQWIAT
jgi:mono/diheme cytochrome c family protein